MTAKKVIALILVVLLLGACAYYLRSVEREDRNNMRDLYSEVEPLQRQREALAAERDGLEFNYALQMRDVGTVQLLIRELDANVYTDIYPLMRDRGIVGVLGISTKQLPGADRKLSIAQYTRLLKDGWGSCLVHEKDYDLAYWYNIISGSMTAMGLDMPTTIFFPDATYKPEMDETLTGLGIQIVVLAAEDGRSSTVTPVDGELWFTGAMPWNYTGVAVDTELLARTDGANLTFTMSLTNLWDVYEEESFERILDSWVGMLDVDDTLETLSQNSKPANTGDPNAPLTQEDELLKPRLKACSYETARELHLTAMEKNSALQKEFEDRQKQLDDEIAALDEQIREVYDRWGKTGKG